jgi:hypothetical protein
LGDEHDKEQPSHQKHHKMIDKHNHYLEEILGKK